MAEILVRMSDAGKARLQAAAHAAGTSMNALVREAIDEKLEREENR